MDILMPQLGETVAEGTIIRWYKSVGDTVAAGDVLFEIETDKTSMEVPAISAGVLSEIRVTAGATVPVGAVLAVLAGAAASEQSADAAAADRKIAPAQAGFDPWQSVRTPERNFGPARLASGIAVTPLARRLAAQMGVALVDVAGSGPAGRIVGRDVKAGPRLAVPAVRAAFADTPFVAIPLDGMRRTIAARMQEAKQRIPHFYLTVDVAVGKLLALRAEANSALGEGARCSLNDFLIKAMAMALQRVPEANAVWAEDCVLRFEQSNVALAVAVPGGLYTPVIRAAEGKTVAAISREMQALIARARGAGLDPGDYRGGSLTISNLGMHGVRAFSAIINPPQSAIVAVGAAERRAVEAADGSVRFESLLTLTLSCDHRVIDGVLGARLLAAFKQLLESPCEWATASA